MLTLTNIVEIIWTLDRLLQQSIKLWLSYLLLYFNHSLQHCDTVIAEISVCRKKKDKIHKNASNILLISSAIKIVKKLANGCEMVTAPWYLLCRTNNPKVWTNDWEARVEIPLHQLGNLNSMSKINLIWKASISIVNRETTRLFSIACLVYWCPMGKEI